MARARRSGVAPVSRTIDTALPQSSTTALHPAEAFARGAAAGTIPCSRWVRLAAERHLRDLRTGATRGLFFDPHAGQHALDFFRFLRHSKGEWAGRPFDLAGWQQFIIWVLFGWKRKNGGRRFRTAHISVARKNGKSTLAAGVGLYLLAADYEPGAEVYCAATKRDQARIVFEEAERMRDASPPLKKRIGKFRNNMHVAATGSKFEPLSSDEDTMDGLNVHGAIVDELQEQKSRNLWDKLDTATSARRQPLLFAICTAGYDRESLCWRQQEYCEKVLEGVLEDDSVFAFIAGIDPDDAWDDERNWPKANPNLDVSTKRDDLRQKALKAKGDPSALNSFLRLHLNRWTQTEVRWMPTDRWNACEGGVSGVLPRELRRQFEEDLAGRRCFGGLDLSSKLDVTAFVLLFPPEEDADDGQPQPWVVLPWFWLPSENIEQRVREGRVPYDVWVADGFIEGTEGNVIDYERIKARVIETSKRFEIEEIGFDAWSATYLAQVLKNDEGLEMVEVGQGWKSMSEPMKELKAMVWGRKLVHLGNPVLRWMASNVVAKEDRGPAENLKPMKPHADAKIDGIVALLMALNRALPSAQAGASVYEHAGITTI
jgi:phage terminase large subunit-like protein